MRRIARAIASARLRNCERSARYVDVTIASATIASTKRGCCACTAAINCAPLTSLPMAFLRLFSWISSTEPDRPRIRQWYIAPDGRASAARARLLAVVRVPLQGRRSAEPPTRLERDRAVPLEPHGPAEAGARPGRRS